MIETFIAQSITLKRQGLEGTTWHGNELTKLDTTLGTEITVIQMQFLYQQPYQSFNVSGSTDGRTDLENRVGKQRIT
jgi:hypothetical protein